MKLKKEIQKARAVSYAPQSNQVAVADQKYDFATKAYKTTVKLYDAASGAPAGEVSADTSLSNIAISKDGTTVTVIGNGAKDTTEKRESTPSGLQPAERTKFRQMHDGRSTQAVVARFGEGAIKKIPSWYSPPSRSTFIRLADKTVLIPFGSNVAVTYGDDGTMSIEPTGPEYHQGSAYNPKTKRFVTGSRCSITIMKQGNQSATQHKLRRLPGYSEYPLQIIRGKDGNWFASTTAFRLVKFNLLDGIEKAVPVF